MSNQLGSPWRLSQLWTWPLITLFCHFSLPPAMKTDKWLPDKWPYFPGPEALKEGDVSLGTFWGVSSWEGSWPWALWVSFRRYRCIISSEKLDFAFSPLKFQKAYETDSRLTRCHCNVQQKVPDCRNNRDTKWKMPYVLPVSSDGALEKAMMCPCWGWILRPVVVFPGVTVIEG